MKDATVTNMHFDVQSREIIVTIDAKGSPYVEEKKKNEGFPSFVNSASIKDGFNLILKHGHIAVDKLQETDSPQSTAEIITRVNQFLSSLDYDKLTDFQAKCALLLERAIAS